MGIVKKLVDLMGGESNKIASAAQWRRFGIYCVTSLQKYRPERGSKGKKVPIQILTRLPLKGRRGKVLLTEDNIMPK